MSTIGKTSILLVTLGLLASAARADNDGSAASAGFARTEAAYLGGPFGSEPESAAIHVQDGVAYAQQGQYDDAVISFRQAAIADPETPHLAAYLIHAEHEQELQQARKLSANQRAQFDQLVAEGKDQIVKKQYAAAQDKLQKALVLEPHNPAVQNLASQAKDLPRKDHDPQAAKMHYEAGLIAYAKNDLQEARKEWLITAQLDSGNPKVDQALKHLDQEIGSQQSAGKADKAQ